MKSNKSISRKFFFDQIPFFTISKMAKNQFLNWGKSLKTAINATSRKKFDLFDFIFFYLNNGHRIVEKKV